MSGKIRLSFHRLRQLHIEGPSSTGQERRAACNPHPNPSRCPIRQTTHYTFPLNFARRYIHLAIMHPVLGLWYGPPPFKRGSESATACGIRFKHREAFNGDT